jgi:hypothetical protein
MPRDEAEPGEVLGLVPEPAVEAVAGAELAPRREEEPADVLGLAPDAGPEPVDEPALVDAVVVSTPAPDLAATVDALGDLDRDIARAVAGAVVERLRALLAPPLLDQVAAEIARALAPPPPADAGEPDEPEVADEPEAAEEPAEPDEAAVHPVPPGRR